MGENERTRLEVKPCRGKFSEWRVLLIWPFEGEKPESVKGARMGKCTRCLPEGEEYKPENLADLEFYWEPSWQGVYSVCPRCKVEMGGSKINPGNGRKKGQRYGY